MPVPPDNNNPLGSFIRDAREITGMSLSEAADLIGCTKSHVWDLEQGRARNPTITILAGLASAYNIDLGDLATIAAASAPGTEFRVAAANVVNARARFEALKK